MTALLIPLRDAVAALREELVAAQEAAEGTALRFDVGQIELEFQVVATKEASGGASWSFKIFGWGGDANVAGKIADQRTHKVKLSLTPRSVDSSDGKFDIARTPAPAPKAMRMRRPGK